MTQRYSTPSADLYGPDGWRTDRTRVVEDYFGNKLDVVVEVADLTDKRGGHVYRDGAWRVSVHMLEAHSDFRVRLSERTKRGLPARRNFKGESAWAAVNRYVDDVEYALRLNRPLRSLNS